MTGRMIGNYRVISKLGEGGMGKVYRAVDTMVEREVALKSLKPEIAARAAVLERFRSEAILLAKLNHPAVAQLYTFFKDGEEYYMVMEYVAGDTLQAFIQKNGSVPYPRALAYTIQILQGIGHAHSMGILHRDLKPANIMLTPAEKVKIMDFGIARVFGAAGMTRDGRVIGTLEYLAPERIRGKQDDPRSDLYSVGVVLYQMVTGHLPFEAESDYDLLTAQIQKQPPRPREIGVTLPIEVETLLMTSLEKDPDRRFPNAAAFEGAVAALATATRGFKVPAKAVEMETRLERLILRTKAAAGPDTKETRLPGAPETAEIVLGRPPAPAPPRAAMVPPPETRVAVVMPGATPGVTPGVPTVAAPVVPPVPTPPRVAKAQPLLYSKTAALLVASLGVVLAGVAGIVLVRYETRPRPAAPLRTAAVSPLPAATEAPPQPVMINPETVGTPPPDASGSPAQTGSGLLPVAPASKSAPAPEKKTRPDAGRSKATDATVSPPAPVPVPAVAPDTRRSAIAALEQTDGPTTGDAGNRPIQMAGLLAALKLGGPAMAQDFEDAVGQRGVNFQLTQARSDALRTAGAPDSLLKRVDASYRASADPAVVKTAEPAPVAVKPVQRIIKLADIKSIYVDCSQNDMRNAVREEIQKQLAAKVKLMDAQAGSDVVMKITVTGPNGGSVSRALGLKDHAQVRATVADTASGAGLWEQGEGDHKPIIGIFQGDSMKRLASRIVKDLKDAIAKR